MPGSPPKLQPAGRPPSKFPLTDAERQLRDLAYPLIEPPYDRERWYNVLAEYGLNASQTCPIRSFAMPRSFDDASALAIRRYSKLNEDIRNDAVVSIRSSPLRAMSSI